MTNHDATAALRLAPLDLDAIGPDRLVPLVSGVDIVLPLLDELRRTREERDANREMLRLLVDALSDRDGMTSEVAVLEALEDAREVLK